MSLFWILLPLSSFGSMWIPDRTREVFSSSLIEKQDVTGALPFNAREDIFASPYPPIGGDSDIAFSSILASLGWVSEDPEDEDFCPIFVEKFFINRPNWFIPTRLEVIRARECFKGFVSLIYTKCIEETVECSLLVSLMDKLAIGLFSDYTEYVLKRLSPSRSFACSSRLESFNWTVFKEAMEAMSTTPDAMAEQVLELLDDESSETGVVHASDYLDMYGMTPESLIVWRKFLSVPHIDRILTREFRKRPDVILKPSLAHFHRLTKLKRDPILTVKLSTGIRVRLVPGTWDLEFTDSHGYSETVHYGREKSKLMRVFEKISEGESSRPLGSPQENSAETIAGLMYMAKITRDPLGTLATAISGVLRRSL